MNANEALEKSEKNKKSNSEKELASWIDIIDREINLIIQLGETGFNIPFEVKYCEEEIAKHYKSRDFKVKIGYTIDYATSSNTKKIEQRKRIFISWKHEITEVN